MGSNDVVQIIGIPKALRKLRKLKDVVKSEAEDAVTKAAYIILREALKITPIDTGALRESGHVITEGQGLNTKALIIFDIFYAIYVHENLESYHAPPTQAKFLEETVKTYRQDVAKYIRERVKQAVAEASN